MAELRFLAGIGALIAVSCPSARAQAICQLCAPVAAPAAAQGTGSGGSISLNPQTGTRSISGGLVSVMGNSFQGTARISGQPFARVRILLPTLSKMHAAQGGTADIVDLVADVPAVATLDATGMLQFHFAGRFAITTADEGDFHGRIQITVDYE
jgi:Domain of unknown function (DUF4402)